VIAQPPRLKRIPSIDGGGIRGIIPATTLVALDAQTGKAVRDRFDFVARTHTGAPKVAALATGFTVKSIFEVYTSQAR
jgi:patatin-like phospholipase/acyl hydrolase